MKKIFFSALAALFLSVILVCGVSAKELSGQCGDNIVWTLDDAGTFTISGSGEMWIYPIGYMERILSDGSCVTLPIYDDYEYKADFGEVKFQDSSIWLIDRNRPYIEYSLPNYSIVPAYTDRPYEVINFPDGSYALVYTDRPYEVIELPDGSYCAVESSFGYRVYTLADGTYVATPAFTIGDDIEKMIISKDVTKLSRGVLPKNARFEIEDGNMVYTTNDSQNVLIENGSILLRYCQDGEANEYAIPDGITQISSSAFSGNSSLSSIIIPNSVTSIGKYAFCGCTSLTDIIIPDSVTAIEKYAFENCTNLRNITIGSGVKKIKGWAFYNCDNITSVSISDIAAWCGIEFEDTLSNPIQGITDFYVNGEQLTDLIVPDGVTVIENYAFNAYDPLTSVTLPDSVTKIGISAFSGCSQLTEAKLGNGIKSIGPEAFCDCSLLKSITIPDGVTRIETWTFAACLDLESITMPKSVETIDRAAFLDCTNLKDIYYTGMPEQWEKITVESENTDLQNATVHFLGCGENLMWFWDTQTGTLTIRGSGEMCSFDLPKDAPWDDLRSDITAVVLEEGVTTVGEIAFYDCTDLTSVTIPVTVTNIKEYAFDSCTKLTDVYYGGTENDWKNIRIDSENASLQQAALHYKALLPMSLSGITLKNAAHETISSIPTGSFIAETAVTNNTGSEACTVIFAAYDAVGRMLDLRRLEANPAVGLTVTVGTDFDNSDGKIAKLKAFVLSNLRAFIVLGNAAEWTRA